MMSKSHDGGRAASMSTLQAVTVDEVSLSEGREMLRLQVSDRLGISLDEFFRRLDAGEFDESDDENVFRLVMLAPFARVA